MITSNKLYGFYIPKFFKLARKKLKAYILWYMESLVNLLIRDSFSISQT